MKKFAMQIIRGAYVFVSMFLSKYSIVFKVICIIVSATYDAITEKRFGAFTDALRSAFAIAKDVAKASIRFIILGKEAFV